MPRDTTRLADPVPDDDGRFHMVCANESCGAPFTATRLDALYCSETCRRGASRDSEKALRRGQVFVTRHCMCGCGATIPLDAPRRNYATAACRVRRHRQLHGVASTSKPVTRQGDTADAPTNTRLSQVARQRQACAWARCRVTFIPRRAGQKYCGTNCRVAAHRARQQANRTGASS